MKSKRTRKQVAHGLEGAAGGAAVGAVAGLVAGPAGVAVGAALGAVAGAVAEAVVEHEEVVDRQHDAVLDAIIGVTSERSARPTSSAAEADACEPTPRENRRRPLSPRIA